jgi:trimeric autotransporter adhesin
VRKITPDLQISTVAGTGVKGFSGDGSLASSAKLNGPYSLALDDAGNLYIEDYNNNRIRKVDAAGIISTVAGQGDCCWSGDNGPALDAHISTNYITADGAGNLYLSNYTAIRKVDTAGVIRLIGGSNTAGFSGDGSAALSATLRGPYGMAVDATGNIYIADTENNRVRKMEINTPAKLEIADGDNQTGTVGQQLAKALRVRVLGSSGAGVAGVVIAFAVTAGDAKLSAPSAVTDQNGVAAISATPNKAGAISISATAGSLRVSFSITAQAGGDGGGPVVDPDTPKISTGGIVQQGYSVPAVKQISPGAIVTIYGENFATKSFVPALAPLTDGGLPVKYAGICVYVGADAAPIFGFTPNQVTVQIPRVASGSIGIQIRRYCGEARELRSNVETVTAQAATPEFLYLKNNSDGVNPVAVHDSVTYQWIGPAGLLPGVESAPAKAGDYLTIYGVGFGDTSPALIAGQTVSGTPRLAQPAQVSIGGVNLSAADVLYIGLSPNYIGLYQLNIRVPQGIPGGNQRITLRVGTSASPAGAYLAMQ